MLSLAYHWGCKSSTNLHFHLEQIEKKYIFTIYILNEKMLKTICSFWIFMKIYGHKNK